MKLRRTTTAETSLQQCKKHFDKMDLVEQDYGPGDYVFIYIPAVHSSKAHEHAQEPLKNNLTGKERPFQVYLFSTFHHYAWQSWDWQNCIYWQSVPSKTCRQGRSSRTASFLWKESPYGRARCVMRHASEPGMYRSHVLRSYCGA